MRIQTIALCGMVAGALCLMTMTIPATAQGHDMGNGGPHQGTTTQPHGGWSGQHQSPQSQGGWSGNEGQRPSWGQGNGGDHGWGSWHGGWGHGWGWGRGWGWGGWGSPAPANNCYAYYRQYQLTGNPYWYQQWQLCAG